MVFATLLKTEFPSEAENAIITLISDVLKNGVVINKAMLLSQSGKGIILHDIQSEKEAKVDDLEVFYDVKTAKDSLKEREQIFRRSITPPELAKAALKLATDMIKPNLTFNKRETELRKDLARKSVKPFYFKVKKGEMLVREGERIRPEHLLKLSEQAQSFKRQEMLGRVPAMAVLIGFLLAAMYLVGILINRSPGEGVKDLLFNTTTLLTVFLVVLASSFVAEEIARGFHFFGPYIYHRWS